MGRPQLGLPRLLGMKVRPARQYHPSSSTSARAIQERVSPHPPSARPRDEVLSRKDLAELKLRLSMMGQTAVQDFYRSVRFVCRIGPDLSRAIHELVHAWRQMRKWRSTARFSDIGYLLTTVPSQFARSTTITPVATATKDNTAARRFEPPLGAPIGRGKCFDCSVQELRP